ncbi:hypothetical protein Hanom_Chr11g01048221 [Helianthus anomalus]
MSCLLIGEDFSKSGIYKTSDTCLQWRVSPFGVDGFGPLVNRVCLCRPALSL